MHKPSLRYFNSFIYYYIYYMRFFFYFFKAKPFILFFSSYPYGEKWFGLSFCCVTCKVTQTKGYSLFFLVFFLLLKRAKKKHTNRSKNKETGQRTKEYSLSAHFLPSGDEVRTQRKQKRRID